MSEHSWDFTELPEDPSPQRVFWFDLPSLPKVQFSFIISLKNIWLLGPSPLRIQNLWGGYGYLLEPHINILATIKWPTIPAALHLHLHWQLILAKLFSL